MTFSVLPQPKPDPIFSLLEMAKSAGPGAINATAGVYIDEDGKPVLYPSVQKALKTVTETLTTRNYNYPSLLGLPEFRKSVATLLFGEDHRSHASIATTGGTGALAVNMRLLAMMDHQMLLLLPVPSWPTHKSLARGASLQVTEVAHIKNGLASPDAILDALLTIEGPVAVLLQTGCHNPTGLDFTEAQWKVLAEAMAERGAIALLDTAYQGFAGEPEADITPLDICLDAGVTVIGCWSAAKNHSLYSERVGMAYAITESDAETKQIEGLYCMITRMLHSAAATFGQSVVAEVQTQHGAAWREDLRMVRTMLTNKRAALEKNLPADCTASLKGHGMFAKLPLKPEEIAILRKEHLFFCADDGRINIAGIPLTRMEELGNAIRSARSSLSR